MRLGMFLSLAFALMLSVWSTPSVAAVGRSHGTTVVALQQPSGGGAPAAQPGGKLDIDINVNHGGSGARWYANPVWIAIGALAVIVLIVLLVMALKGGGGTTVIRD
jgi:hypothetical protein